MFIIKLPLFFINLYIICINTICHNFYGACFVFTILFVIYLFIYSVMLINTLFSLFDLMLHVYTCLSDFSINCSIWIPLMARCTRCLCDKFCQWLAADRLFSPSTLYCFLRVLYTVSSGYSILFSPGTLYCFLRVLYTVSSGYSILFSPGTLYCFLWVLLYCFLRVLYTVSSGYSILFSPCTLCCFLH